MIAVNEYLPDDRGDFSVWMELLIGVKGEVGSDSFEIMVSSSRWIENRLNDDKIMWGSYSLIVNEYNYSLIIGFISKSISKVMGKDWSEISMKLKAFASWEFDNYS